MTMEHFKELDMFMAVHLCRLRTAPKWQMISYFFKEVEKQRQDEWQEAFEAQQHAIRLDQVRRVLGL